MVYAIVVHHRHKSGHKTLVQGRADLLEFVKSKVEQDKLKVSVACGGGGDGGEFLKKPKKRTFNTQTLLRTYPPQQPHRISWIPTQVRQRCR